MILTILVGLISATSMALSALFYPNIKIKKFKFPIYCVFPLFGAIILLLTQSIDFNNVLDVFLTDSSVNPLQILILFISMVFISTLLDEEGFFSFLAEVSLSKAKGNQYNLFTFLFIFVSFLTIFTSNDIIVLTFTPFIISFCKRANINPLPYLFAEFVAANTFSSFLPVGNPTNIFLTESLNIDWGRYLLYMSLPSIITGMVAYTILLLIFKNQLKSHIEANVIREEKIKDKFTVVICLISLFGAIVCCALSSFLPIRSYLCCFIIALVLLLVRLLYGSIKKKTKEPINTLKRLPYSLLPLLIGMFIIVIGLGKYEIGKYLGEFLSVKGEIYTFGLSSFLIANIINNIPMSVLYEEIFLSINYTPSAVFSVILSSNIAAYLTPFGALAGIMFLNKSHEQNIKLSFTKFCLVGLSVSLPSLLLGLTTLQIVSSI